MEIVHIKAEVDPSGFIKFCFDDQQTWLSEVPLLGNSDILADDDKVPKKPASNIHKKNIHSRGYHQHVKAYQRECEAQGIAPNPEVQKQKGKEGARLALQEAGLL